MLNDGEEVAVSITHIRTAAAANTIAVMKNAKAGTKPPQS